MKNARIPFLVVLASTLACKTPVQQSFRPSDIGKVQAVTHEVPARGYDVEHYALELALYPEARRIEAECRVRLVADTEGLSRLHFDFEGLTVLGVTDRDGRELGFEHAEDALFVTLSEPLRRGTVEEVTVRYAGTPVKGLWFSGAPPGVAGAEPTQVFTQGESEYSRGWFPCFDHPSDRATSEVRVTMPTDWVSIAPGERIDVQEGASSRTEHWRMDTPHPSYLVSLVAGELEVWEESWNGVPLLFVAESRYADWIEASFNETDEILDFLGGATGIPYPFSKYSQACVANFPWGGMENISATTLTPLTLDDERGNRDETSTELVAHEAAHQWFGDLFTCADWSDIWLNEGFATYMTLLYIEETRGKDEFLARLRNAQDEYLTEDQYGRRRPTVTRVWKDPDDLFDSRVYEGAAARLHLLRFWIGDEAFREGVRIYCAENAGKSVVTADLRRAMEKSSGLDLETFFSQWIYGRGFPEFVTEWSWDQDKGEVSFEVRQVQRTGDGTPAVFRLPVEIEILDESGTAAHRVFLEKPRERFAFPVSGRPFYVRFDKGGWIPKVMRWQKRGAEWLAIANSDDDVNGRRDACRALGILSESARRRNDLGNHATYVAELGARVERDKISWVRVSAAEALGRAQGFEAERRLVDVARSDPEARVRVAALEALVRFGESAELAAVARECFEAGYSWRTMGAAAGLLCSAAPGAAFAFLSEKLYVESPHDQLAALLLLHMGRLPDPLAGAKLRTWAQEVELHPTARAAALRALSDIGRDRATNSRFIAEFLVEENFRLRAAAVEALATANDDNARKALFAYYPSARTPTEQRAIEAVFSGPRF